MAVAPYVMTLMNGNYDFVTFCRYAQTNRRENLKDKAMNKD